MLYYDYTIQLDHITSRTITKTNFAKCKKSNVNEGSK